MNRLPSSFTTSTGMHFFWQSKSAEFCSDEICQYAATSKVYA